MAEPKEHITDEQIEKLFKLADEIVRAPSRFTKDFIVENLALGVADLCGVIDRLREQLAEIGETRTTIQFRACQSPDGPLIDWTDLVVDQSMMISPWPDSAGRIRLDFRQAQP